MPPKLTFDEALERLNEQRAVDAENVQAAALRRHVWINANGLPGCMYDSIGYNVTKADAIESALQIADTDGMNGQCAPRGLKTNLSARGTNNAWVDETGYLYKVKRVTLGELL